jgi:hypothetical protein
MISTGSDDTHPDSQFLPIGVGSCCLT